MINEVVLVGNLTRDVELKHDTKSPLMTGSIAVNERRKKDGEWIDYPNFIDFAMFGDRVLKLEKFLTKGRKICIHGHLHQQRWTVDGQNRSKLEVTVDNIEFMSRPADERKVEVYEEDIPF